MRTFRLVSGDEHWQVGHDEQRRTLTVQGPSPEASRIHRWLTTSKRVVDRSTGGLLTVVPIERWDHMVQAVESDPYGDLQRKAVFE